MGKVVVAAAVIGFAAWIAHDYYKAIRHEFYQVWDSIEEVRKKI